MVKSTAIILVIVVSEVIAVFLIRNIWRRDDYKFMKILMSVVALIPVVGLLGVIWAYGFHLCRTVRIKIENRAISRLLRFSTDGGTC